ncbi:enoyl-CoA hydratase-related protein [Sinorhizobium americanum]|uniref:3-hydroxybutyryl-CoA dehydratase n=1 Tax=Sinorhizobium americanum TaxID=194963 RepID=A0A1L3LYP7_9HYPH|nr:enoyl-CoA hydratase-related protein [Sinorhizobium americanum]APG95191.1 3-hydroxybutyryl-CoA dehydratase [Sinorhizobium americanum]OAP39730.1 3-hydroxybutyryl-CoA dehydratase [Sinorhizobium americanum]
MSDILVESKGGVAVVTLSRPGHRNAVTYAMWRQLADQFSAFDREPSVRSIILTGAGADFSAGADISEFDAVRNGLEDSKSYEVAVDAAGDAIYQVSKPTIAALRGYCLGGAAHLAMSCDFRIAEKNSVFGIPAARLSIVYGVSATRKLYSLVGVTEAKRILFSARRFDAGHALDIGFIDQVADSALVAAHDRAAELAENAPLTIAGAKFILNGCAHGTLDQAAADRLIDEASASHDYSEGRQAFKDKRPPLFLGK